MLVEEKDLDFSQFHCCGDEDLYPFGCPSCGRPMIFCYECDTLYSNLHDLTDKTGRSIRSIQKSQYSLAQVVDIALNTPL